MSYYPRLSRKALAVGSMRDADSHLTPTSSRIDDITDIDDSDGEDDDEHFITPTCNLKMKSSLHDTISDMAVDEVHSVKDAEPASVNTLGDADLLMALAHSLGLRSLREYCQRGSQMLKEAMRHTQEMQSALMYLAHGNSTYRHATAVLAFESDTTHVGEMSITHGAGGFTSHRLATPPSGLEFCAEIKSGVSPTYLAMSAVKGSIAPMWDTMDVIAFLRELTDGFNGSTTKMKQNAREKFPHLHEMLNRILLWDETLLSGPLVQDKRTEETYTSINFKTVLNHEDLVKHYPSLSNALKFLAHIGVIVTDINGVKQANLDSGQLNGAMAHSLLHFTFETDSQTVVLKAFKKGKDLLWSTNGGMSPCVDPKGHKGNEQGGYRTFSYNLPSEPDLFLLIDVNAALAFGLDIHLPTVAMRITSGYQNMTGINIRLFKMFPTWTTALASWVIDIDGLFGELQRTFLLNLTIQSQTNAITCREREREKANILKETHSTVYKNTRGTAHDSADASRYASRNANVNVVEIKPSTDNAQKSSTLSASSNTSGPTITNTASNKYNSISGGSKNIDKIHGKSSVDVSVESMRDKVCVVNNSSPMVLSFSFDATAPTSVFTRIFQRVWDKLVDKLLWVEIFSYLDDLNSVVAKDCDVGIRFGHYDG
eukprot:CFRG0483T1